MLLYSKHLSYGVVERGGCILKVVEALIVVPNGTIRCHLHPLSFIPTLKLFLPSCPPFLIPKHKFPLHFSTSNHSQTSYSQVLYNSQGTQITYHNQTYCQCYPFTHNPMLSTARSNLTHAYPRLLHLLQVTTLNPQTLMRLGFLFFIKSLSIIEFSIVYHLFESLSSIGRKSSVKICQ